VGRQPAGAAPGPLDEVAGGWEALGDYQRPTAETARREPHRSVRAIARHMEPFLADPPSFLGRGLSDVVPYVVLFAVLLWLPSGLFGTREVHRV